MRLAFAFLGMAAALVAGCDSTNRAVFVTATSVGINADATTHTVNFGYDRAEGFIGPNYVDAGMAPSVVGYVNSNLEIFSPRIKQLYATGEAADAVTDPTASKAPAPPASPPTMTGQRRIMVFGTSSTVGVKLGLAGGMPDSIVFGYKRKEMSVIPFRSSDPDATLKQEDTYASVLAAMDMNLTTAPSAVSLSTTPAASSDGVSLGVVQFMATGQAAQNLARDSQIRSLFQSQASEAVKRASLTATTIKESAGGVVACVTKADGTLDTPRLGAIIDLAAADKLVDPTVAKDVKDAANPKILGSRLVNFSDVAAGLTQYIGKNKNVCVSKGN